ncbi:MAG: histidine kinase [Cellulophaga sp.]
MELHKKNRERLFWLLQFVGWGMTNSMLFIMPFGFSKTYILFSFLGGTILGIAVTSLYRFYLKKNASIEAFGKKQLIRLIVAFVVCSLVYCLGAFLIELIYESIWTRTEKEIMWIKKHMNITIAIVNMAITILGWTAIYYGIKSVLRMNQNNLESLELNATLREAQLNTLKGQINPHFMFNSLNNIRGLMLEDVSKSREMITKLSGMLQFALAKDIGDAIPLEEELEMVENYIALSKIQMEDRLEFIKEISSRTLGISIPPMIIQLLVENAAKHGISNLKEGGLIQLKTNLGNEYLHITVTNTGKLQISKDSTQLGLKNIKQRLRLLYENKAYFSLKEEGNKVIAAIKIPMS